MTANELSTVCWFWASVYNCGAGLDHIGHSRRGGRSMTVCPTCGSVKRATRRLFALSGDEYCPNLMWDTCRDKWHEEESVSLVWDYESEQRQKRLSRSQPIDWKGIYSRTIERSRAIGATFRLIHWWRVFGIGGATLLSIAFWRFVWVLWLRGLIF